MLDSLPNTAETVASQVKSQKGVVHQTPEVECPALNKSDKFISGSSFIAAYDVNLEISQILGSEFSKCHKVFEEAVQASVKMDPFTSCERADCFFYQ